MSNTHLYAVRDQGRIGSVAVVFETRDDAALTANPALGVLTAITSLESARHAIARSGEPLVDLVYTFNKATAVPEPMMLALRAAHAKHSFARVSNALIASPPPEVSLLEVIELAMSGVVDAAHAHLETDHPYAALQLLAHEPVPDRGVNQHEPEYWQRGFEWIALVAAAVEDRPGFAWRLEARAGTIKQLGERRYIANHPIAPFDVALGNASTPLHLPELVEQALATHDFGALLAFAEP